MEPWNLQLTGKPSLGALSHREEVHGPGTALLERPRVRALVQSSSEAPAAGGSLRDPPDHPCLLVKPPFLLTLHRPPENHPSRHMLDLQSVKS